MVSLISNNTEPPKHRILSGELCGAGWTSPVPFAAPSELARFGGPSPPSCSLGLAGLWPDPGMRTLAVIAGKRLRPRETLPWVPRPPAKGCSAERNRAGVLFPPPARSPSCFGLGLSAWSSGKLAASPASPGARAPSDVVCPKRSSVGRKQNKKRVIGTVVLAPQALLLPESSRHPGFVAGAARFAPGSLRGEADAARGLHPEARWKVLGGCAALPASPACTTGRGRSQPAAPGRLVLTCRERPASHPLLAAGPVLSQPRISSLLGNGEFPPGRFQWMRRSLAFGLAAVSPSLLKVKPRSPRRQRFPKLLSLRLWPASGTSIPSLGIAGRIPQPSPALASPPAPAPQPPRCVHARLSPFPGTAIGRGGFGEPLPHFGAGRATSSSPVTSPGLCVMARFSELKRKHPFPLLFLGFRLKKAFVVSLCKPPQRCPVTPGLVAAAMTPRLVLVPSHQRWLCSPVSASSMPGVC